MKVESKYEKTQIKTDICESGESIEEMVRRCLASNEPIVADAPMIYTDKADGVIPAYDPRTDTRDLALDAIDKFQASEIAKTENKIETPSQPATTEITE